MKKKELKRLNRKLHNELRRWAKGSSLVEAYAKDTVKAKKFEMAMPLKPGTMTWAEFLKKMRDLDTEPVRDPGAPVSFHLELETEPTPDRTTPVFNAEAPVFTADAIATARIPSDRLKPNASIKVTAKGEVVSGFGLEFGFTDTPTASFVRQERYDKMHRRAQKAEGANSYLYKSLRRYEKMLEQAYLIIGTEIGRGTRLVMDPVPLIKDAQLMFGFKNALHSGYKAGESLSPELKHGEKTITINTHEVSPTFMEEYARQFQR